MVSEPSRIKGRRPRIVSAVVDTVFDAVLGPNGVADALVNVGISAVPPASNRGSMLKKSNVSLEGA